MYASLSPSGSMFTFKPIALRLSNAFSTLESYLNFIMATPTTFIKVEEK